MECHVKRIEILKFAPAIFSIAIFACSKPEPIDFDSSNDWHCVLAFEDTLQAAKEGGGEELAQSMAFRAEWAEARARRLNLTELTAGQKSSLRNQLASSARAGSESTIACRHRQNSDPTFPRNKTL